MVLPNAKTDWPARLCLEPPMRTVSPTQRGAAATECSAHDNCAGCRNTAASRQAETFPCRAAIRSGRSKTCWRTRVAAASFPPMTNLSQPVVILTHESDLDGLLSGLLLQKLAFKLFGVIPKMVSSHADEWQRRQLPTGPVWVADLGFDPKMDKPNWVVIDHHINRARPEVARLIHDPAKSAARLCYELCCSAGLGSPALERLVHLNDVSDLFLVGDPDFVLACDYANLVKSYQFWTVHDLIEGNPEKLLDHPLLEVMAVKRKVEDPIGLAWSKNHLVRISDEVGYADIRLGNSNMIAYQMLEERTAAYPVLASVCRGVNGAIIASFRSRNGKALQIAERFKGGGHANAAAAVLPRSIQKIPDALEYLKKILNPVAQEETTNDPMARLLDKLEDAGAGSPR